MRLSSTVGAEASLSLVNAECMLACVLRLICLYFLVMQDNFFALIGAWFRGLSRAANYNQLPGQIKEEAAKHDVPQYQSSGLECRNACCVALAWVNQRGKRAAEYEQPPCAARYSGRSHCHRNDQPKQILGT